MSLSPVFELEQVTKSFTLPKKKGSLCALKDLSLTIHKGEYVCLLGKSGCGKSTMLSLLSGLETPTSGYVKYQGKMIVGTHPKRMLMFQEAGLFPWLNVTENILFGMQSRKEYPPLSKKSVPAIGFMP